ncbi:hypothetical protein Z046_33130 [Pseudomonas aeruginosa VRFPA09]|nr:hypothetical protein Z046_33130 [Pseudomonas aeruginosa VRFPA09]
MALLTTPDSLLWGAVQLEVDSGARCELLIVISVGIGVDGSRAPGSACLLQHSCITGLSCAIAPVHDGEAQGLKLQSLVARDFSHIGQRMQGPENNDLVPICFCGKVFCSKPDRLRRRFKCTGNSMMLLGEVQNFSKIFFAPAALNA